MREVCAINRVLEWIERNKEKAKGGEGAEEGEGLGERAEEEEE